MVIHLFDMWHMHLGNFANNTQDTEFPIKCVLDDTDASRGMWTPHPGCSSKWIQTVFCSETQRS